MVMKRNARKNAGEKSSNHSSYLPIYYETLHWRSNEEGAIKRSSFLSNKTQLFRRQRGPSVRSQNVNYWRFFDAAAHSGALPSPKLHPSGQTLFSSPFLWPPTIFMGFRPRVRTARERERETSKGRSANPCSDAFGVKNLRREPGILDLLARHAE